MDFNAYSGMDSFVYSGLMLMWFFLSAIVTKILFTAKVLLNLLELQWKYCGKNEQFWPFSCILNVTFTKLRTQKYISNG